MTLLELLYVVEWDDEGSFSEVKRKWLVDDPDPSVGQKVKVREGSRKKVFSGTVMMKGTYCGLHTLWFLIV